VLVECAVGDAYGAGFEFHDAALPRNDLSAYLQHPKHAGIRPGMYTDDTAMSLAVAEALLSGEPWTPRLLAEYFVWCFRRDPREGYAKRFYEFLTQTHIADEFLANIRPDSERSGAAMRVGPVGLLPTEALVREYATVQAEVTHRTRAGVDSAVAAALMVFHLRHGEPPASVGRLLDAAVPGYDWATPYTQCVSVLGVECVRAAVTAVTQRDSLAAILRHVVGLGGDVDTAAAIALSAASVSPSIQRDLPAHLYEGLENGPYGRDYLKEMDRRLDERFAMKRG
jgi:ADP-ribosylglycohydrolase